MPSANMRGVWGVRSGGGRFRWDVMCLLLGLEDCHLTYDFETRYMACRCFEKIDRNSKWRGNFGDVELCMGKLN